MPNVSFEVYASGFLERFFESHAVMLQGNAGLKPKAGEVTSRPWQWPVNYRVFVFLLHLTTLYAKRVPTLEHKRMFYYILIFSFSFLTGSVFFWQ